MNALRFLSNLHVFKWCVFNIVNDPVFNNPEAIRGTCDGMELFNDFTYTASYNQELRVVPIEAPYFRIPCFNGKINSFSNFKSGL